MRYFSSEKQMTFVASLKTQISNDESIVLPISMHQPLERGDRLASILSYLKTYGLQANTTILICDYLNRHNNLSDETALALGDEFIDSHKDLLHDFKIVRWKDYMDYKGEEFIESLKTIYSTSQINSRFYEKMKKTWEKCLSANYSLEASIKYQQEEYAIVACMDEFSHLIYPKRITNGMSYLYGNFNCKMPIYHHIKISEIKNESKLSYIEKNIHQEKNRQRMHIAFRSIIEHVESLLSSNEMSENAKKMFIEEMENILIVNSNLISANSNKTELVV